MERDPILVEREKTHGSFKENGRTWQTICSLATNTKFVDNSQGLAFDMISLKLARLIQNPNVKDHWDDIAGYAKLGSEACE